jgi:hypothetical protein
VRLDVSIAAFNQRFILNLWNLWVLPSGNEIGFLAEVIGVYISS